MSKDTTTIQNILREKNELSRILRWAAYRKYAVKLLKKEWGSDFRKTIKLSIGNLNPPSEASYIKQKDSFDAWWSKLKIVLGRENQNDEEFGKYLRDQSSKILTNLQWPKGVHRDDLLKECLSTRKKKLFFSSVLFSDFNFLVINEEANIPIARDSSRFAYSRGQHWVSLTYKSGLRSLDSTIILAVQGKMAELQRKWSEKRFCSIVIGPDFKSDALQQASKDLIRLMHPEQFDTLDSFFRELTDEEKDKLKSVVFFPFIDGLCGTPIVDIEKVLKYYEEKFK